MNAKEALELASKTTENLVNLKLSFILANIKEKAEKGFTYTTICITDYPIPVSTGVVKKLKDKGYSTFIEDHLDEETYLEIRWDS